MAGSTTILDAPDSAVRRIRQKRADGMQLSSREYTRLGTREAVEQETARIGGIVRDPVTSTPETPFEYGKRRKKAEEEYKAGYNGATPGTPAAANISGASAPPSAGAQPEAPQAVRRAPPSAAGPIDVRSYTGSMWAPPGSPMAAKPNAETDADTILRRRFGAPPNERGVVDISRGGPDRPKDTATMMEHETEPSTEAQPVRRRNFRPY
jgi:hypothetical protein